jgi:hypothetical protein
MAKGAMRLSGSLLPLNTGRPVLRLKTGGPLNKTVLQESMRTTILVSIILRLFAIQWGLTGIVSIMGLLGNTRPLPSHSESLVAYWFDMLSYPLIYILAAFLVWLFATPVAKRITSNSDTEIGLVSLSARDLYGLGILVVGLVVFLRHLAPMLNWVHYLVLNRAGDALVHGRDGLSLYDVTQEIFVCLGGALLALASPKIGARLARAGRAKEAEQVADGKPVTRPS